MSQGIPQYWKADCFKSKGGRVLGGKKVSKDVPKQGESLLRRKFERISTTATEKSQQS